MAASHRTLVNEVELADPGSGADARGGGGAGRGGVRASQISLPITHYPASPKIFITICFRKVCKKTEILCHCLNKLLFLLFPNFKFRVKAKHTSTCAVCNVIQDNICSDALSSV